FGDRAARHPLLQLAHLLLPSSLGVGAGVTGGAHVRKALAALPGANDRARWQDQIGITNVADRAANFASTTVHRTVETDVDAVGAYRTFPAAEGEGPLAHEVVRTFESKLAAGFLGVAHHDHVHSAPSPPVFSR